MLISRDGRSPAIHPSARVATTAQIIGDVAIGAECFIDYNAVIASSGAPIRIGDRVIVLANSVIRSVGGLSRPSFAVEIGDRTLISPLCALSGCQIGCDCYIATNAMIFQGAVVGDACRVAASAIVHLRTVLPPGTRVGLRQIAVPAEAGFTIHADAQSARAALAQADFFKTVFDTESADQQELHSNVIAKLLLEVSGWTDEPVQ